MSNDVPMTDEVEETPVVDVPEVDEDEADADVDADVDVPVEGGDAE